ncbi:hypothetical protein SAMN06298226_1577 [Nitrosovibrio sp. Nv4]|nr:hypothetical protein SAMN06298226_1577 [Nitrosovibrio sp. Nv4]
MAPLAKKQDTLVGSISAANTILAHVTFQVLSETPLNLCRSCLVRPEYNVQPA